MGRGQHMAGLLSQQLWIAHVCHCMAISLAAYSPAAHRPSLVMINLLVNGHVKGAWLYNSIYGLGSLVPRPREEKGLVYIEHFLGLADSAVLISDVPIRTLPCDMLSNNHVTWCC